MYKITQKKQLNDDVYQMTVLAPRVAKRALAGHFVVIRIDEVGERIPLTISYANKETGEVELVIQSVGHSTRKLKEYNEGDYIKDIMGPLGKPTVIHSDRKNILGIAGGVGAAPILPQLIAYKETGAKVTLITGGRTDKHLILMDRLSATCDEVYPCTNDGSVGHKGFVTDVLKDMLAKDPHQFDEVIAIGPAVMMKAVVEITKQYNVPTSVSLNPIMIDGTGMCGECRVSVGGETKFACVDGPDFDGLKVDFDELMRRQRIFKKEEEHACRMEQEVKKNA